MSVAGIDFGSKSNVVALARRKGIDVVMNEESKRETPSLINFGDKCVGVSRLIFLIFQSRRFSREERKNRSSPSQHATHTQRERERERKRERESETSARKKKRTTRPVLPHRAVRLADAIVVNIALSDGIWVCWRWWWWEAAFLETSFFSLLFTTFRFLFFFHFEGLFAPKT